MTRTSRLADRLSLISAVSFLAARAITSGTGDGRFSPTPS